ncbi:8007_t:CDS:2, partial [Racocetra persica]
NPINYNLAKEKQHFTYDIWIRMIKDMEDDDDIEDFEDNKHWDISIQFLQRNNPPFDWSILPANYQQMTQLYRQTLYYKKMLERVPANPQITYEYTQTILVVNKIRPNIEEDIIVSRLNQVKWIKTEEYLAMLFAEWIKINVVSGTDLPPGIPDAIAGA